MNKQSGWITLAVLSVIVAALFIAVAQLSTPNITVRDSAVALALITGSAVGIERVLEGFWTMVDLLGNAWWPMNKISADIKGLVTTLDAPVQGFTASATGTITALKSDSNIADNLATGATTAINQINNALTELKASGLDNQTIQSYVAKLSRNLTSVSNIIQDPQASGKATAALGVDLKSNLLFAQQALDDLSQFADSFKDNPGRRFVSIFIGAILGLMVSWVAGLDVFQAVLGSPTPQAAGSAASSLASTLTTTLAPTSAPGAFLPYIGVALTGLVIGLGSSPTHEIIQLLQEAKKGRKQQNQATDTGNATANISTLAS